MTLKWFTYIVSKNLDLLGAVGVQLFWAGHDLTLHGQTVSFLHKVSELRRIDGGRVRVGQDQADSHQHEGLLHDDETLSNIQSGYFYQNRAYQNLLFFIVVQWL